MWSTGSRGGSIPLAVPPGDMTHLVASVTRDSSSSTIAQSSSADLSGELIEGGVKTRELIILLLNGSLRGPESLTLETLVIEF